MAIIRCLCKFIYFQIGITRLGYMTSLMAIPRKKSEVICFYDLQYRWNKRSTTRGVEIRIELNETPDGQQIVAQCPRVFRPDMVEDIIAFGRENGWIPEEKGEAIIVRLTKRGLQILSH